MADTIRCFLLCAICASALRGQHVPSGVADIDALRKAVRASASTPGNALERNSILNSWFRLLLHQGINLDATIPLMGALSDPADPGYLKALDEAYSTLERIQANPLKFETKAGREDAGASGEIPRDWPQFQANQAQTGYSPNPGPSKGRVAWTFPIGHAWYSKPVVEDGVVYVTSPGITTTLYALSQKRGEVIWKNRQHGLHAYGSARMSSSPVVLRDSVVIRGSGQFDHGNAYPSARLLFVDKRTGNKQRTVEAGHVDYRRGYAPLSGSGKFLAVIRGEQNIRHRPPLIWMLNTVVLKDAASGADIWSIRVGDVFGDALIDGDKVFVGTDGGLLYCLNTEGPARVAWTFDAGSPLRGTPAVSGDTVYVAALDGGILAIQRESGRLKWRSETRIFEPRAFRLFSDIAVAPNHRLYVGAAERQVYCIDATTGKILWKIKVNDWVRSRPLVIGPAVFVATMDGTVYRLGERGGSPYIAWQKKVSTHQILADLAGDMSGILVSSNDLQVHSLNPDSGEPQWRHSLLEAANIDGQRVEADIIAGGADYQSSPSVVKGRVFIGSPNRFVYAVDTQTGKEIWRFETSGQVSGSPLVLDGRVYFGQQGGNRDFYAVDAQDGSPVWRRQVGWAWVGATASEGNIFFGTADGDIYCLRARDGGVVWSVPTNGGVYPSIAIDSERAYTGSWDGHFFGLDKRTGRIVWAYNFGRPDSGAPTLYDGKLFTVAYVGYMFAIDAAMGSEVWKRAVPAGRRVNGTSSAHGGRFYSSDYIQQGRTPVGSRVLAIDARDGSTVWEHPVGGGLTAPVIAQNKICFASTEHTYFTCVDAAGNGDGTTKMLWRVRIGGTVEESCPAVYGDKAFVLAADRFLYAFE